VIVDLPRFVHTERPYWEELEAALRSLQDNPERRMTLAEVQRLHYLYERSSAALARIGSFAADAGLRSFLESLVARAYSQIHETRSTRSIRWQDILFAFPRAFRRHRGAFRLAAVITALGCGFGWLAIRQDARNKAVLMPFPGLMASPAERVALEESAKADRLTGVKATFSAQLMTNNIRVTILAMALGMTWGAGTVILLFWNGVILGAVMADYIIGSQSVFLAGWLLPHGSVEIPAILLGGQAGLMLAGALIGAGPSDTRIRATRAERLRALTHDLFAIVAGAAVLLVWAGMVEAFVSQYHQPVIPYGVKIAFGVCELAALIGFLGWAGRE
jgi:uncharacterized membrane protein SpoIIM required for sporulation